MRIDSVRLLHMRLPLAAPEPFGERALTDRELVTVELRSGSSIGRGEANPGTFPNELGEFAAASFLLLRDWLAPAIIGCELSSGRALAERLQHVAGNPAAKAALDAAWWRLEAALQGTDLDTLVGARQTGVQTGTVLGVRPTIDELLSDIQAAVAAGSTSIGLKFRPGWALEVVRAVRSVHPTLPLWIDCDGLCRLSQREMFFRLDDFLLERIEQPLAADDLVGHAMLAEGLRTPIALDQSATSLERVEQALELASCRQVRIDPQRVGGITSALEIAAACRAAGATVLAGLEHWSTSGEQVVHALARTEHFTPRVELPGLRQPAALAAEVIVAESLL